MRRSELSRDGNGSIRFRTASKLPASGPFGFSARRKPANLSEANRASMLNMFSMKNQANQYFFWIDILRGLAATAVLVWHYQHFYMLPSGKYLWTDHSDQPFFVNINFLYTHGFLAVHLFWVISGFVFASIYATRPEILNAFEFANNRISRLYPLHFITLIIVAILQIISYSILGHYQIYPFNDLYHFALNLFFASSWGFEHGYSFNAPIWSVSVEVLIYAVFFASVPLVSKWIFSTPIISGVFLVFYLEAPIGTQIWLCGLFFFLGCFVFKLWYLFGSKVALLCGLAGFGLATLTHDFIFELAAFSSLVLVAASLDHLDTFRLGSKIRILGDLTYSTYLWHVPIQILVLTVIELFAIDRTIVSTPWFFGAFLVTVFVTSFFSFNYIETPTRRAIRSYFQQRYARVGSVAATK
jgi:peptidoglycan/LPS O-acetylase OafA/YrhL